MESLCCGLELIRVSYASGFGERRCACRVAGGLFGGLYAVCER